MRDALCPVCDRPLVLGEAAIRGHKGSVEVEVAALPVLHCPMHGSRRFPMRDFGNDFLEGVWRLLRPAARRPLRFLTPRCDRDRVPLRDPPEPRWFEGTIALSGVPTFRARVRVPSLRCPTCHMEQVATARNLDASVADALLDALQRAAIPR